MKAPEIKHYINWLGRVEYRKMNPEMFLLASKEKDQY